MRRWQWIIPLAFGLAIGTALFLLSPIDFQPYKLTHLSSSGKLNYESYLYADVNGDGKDDEIRCGGKLVNENNTLEKCHCCRVVGIGEDMGEFAIAQYTVPEMMAAAIQAFGANYDGNKMDELYIPTAVGDSLFLHIFENPKYGVARKAIFLDTALRHKGVMNLDVVPWSFEDLNGDGYKELTLSVMNSYPVYPRRIYRVDIKNETVTASPSTCINIFPLNGRSDFNYQNAGGFNPVYGNYKLHMDIPYPDTCGYAFVLNDKLQFNFDPIPLYLYPGEGRNAVWKNQLISAFTSAINKDSAIVQWRNPQTGKLLGETIIPGSNPHISTEGKHLEIVTDNSVHYFDADQNLLKIKNLQFPAAMRRFNADINKDGEREHFMLEYESNRGFLISEDWSHKQYLNIGKDRYYYVYKREMGDNNAQMVVKANDQMHYYQYSRNPYSWLQWPFYGLLFAGSSGISMLVFRLFQRNIEKRYRKEQQMTQLQMLSIKNQVEPHFTLNALDSIEWMYRNQEGKKAARYLEKLTRLIHQTVLNSENFEISLFEELDFCRNYCELEKLRDPEFTYDISVSEEVDLFKLKIPRQLLFIQVENAIKHALRPKFSEKVLQINIRRQGEKILVIISDNGNPNPNSKASYSTGKGLKITSELLSLYQQTRKQNIRFQRNSDADGTTISLAIPL